MIAILH